MQNLIENFFKTNFKKLPSSIVVAVSGGVDSMALVFALNKFSCKKQINLLAVTIDHKMRQNSAQEAQAVQKILQAHKIAHTILTLDEMPQKNIEANLREARYSRLYEFCLSSKVDNLFLGHHQGDAAENFLIRLFRGSQIDGLAAMQEIVKFKKIKLCRPFLNAKKEDLQKYLQAQKIKWFEDESNDDEKFLRNKIRKFFVQFEDKDLIQKRVVDAAKNLAETKELLEEILLREAAQCLVLQQDGSFIIDSEKYQKIPPKIALKILSLVLIEVSGNIYKPRLEGLKIFEKNILNLAKSKKKNFYGCMAQAIKIKGKQALQIHIYRDENAAKNSEQIFDEKTVIIDGRFLADKKTKKINQFYFRTILKKAV